LGERSEVGDGDIDMLNGSVVFDLLLTDISMPGPTDGNALAVRAKLPCTGIQVSYLSGHPDSLTNNVGDHDVFIQKPVPSERGHCLLFGGWNQSRSWPELT